MAEVGGRFFHIALYVPLPVHDMHLLVIKQQVAIVVAEVIGTAPLGAVGEVAEVLAFCH